MVFISLYYGNSPKSQGLCGSKEFHTCAIQSVLNTDADSGERFLPVPVLELVSGKLVASRSKVCDIIHGSIKSFKI